MYGAFLFEYEFVVHTRVAVQASTLHRDPPQLRVTIDIVRVCLIGQHLLYPKLCLNDVSKPLAGELHVSYPRGAN